MAQALASLSLNIVGSIWMQYISWEECAQRADERITKEKQSDGKSEYRPLNQEDEEY